MIEPARYAKGRADALALLCPIRCTEAGCAELATTSTGAGRGDRPVCERHDPCRS